MLSSIATAPPAPTSAASATVSRPCAGVMSSAACQWPMSWGWVDGQIWSPASATTSARVGDVQRTL
eukprot:scaffold140894_cov96-Phaeocystis_antarctica.AAC.1